MAGFIGVIVAAVVGVLLAVGSGFMLVSSQSATPAVVEAPYITYDS